nr:hypothetical protein [Candidatus Cloacimonadota bacterium]
MNKIKIAQKWNFTDVKNLKLTNKMAPLSIVGSDGSEIELSGELSVAEQTEEFNFEDYISAKFSEGEFKLDLNEIPTRSKSRTDSQLLLTVPANIFMRIALENLPLSVKNMQNKMRIDSENAPLSISMCDGDKHVESINGPVRIMDSKGSLYAKLGNGPFTAEQVGGAGIHIESVNGPLKLRQAAFTKVKIVTENGPIYYETQPIEGGDFSFSTENGIVHLALPLNFGFKLEAKSESGRVKSKLDAEVIKDDNVFRVEHIYEGEEPTKIKIDTENGLIKLSSDSQLDINFIKDRLEQLKETLKNVNTPEELEKVTAKLNKMTDYLHRSAQSINEEKIKNKVTDAINKMKSMVMDFNLDETKNVVIGKIENLSSEIYDGIREGLKNAKAEFDDLRYEHLNKDSLKDYIHKVVNSPLIKPYLGAEKKKAEKEKIAEHSRLKILEMLEKGKITSEEAEKLLKAINKE